MSTNVRARNAPNAPEAKCRSEYAPHAHRRRRPAATFRIKNSHVAQLAVNLIVLAERIFDCWVVLFDENPHGVLHGQRRLADAAATNNCQRARAHAPSRLAHARMQVSHRGCAQSQVQLPSAAAGLEASAHVASRWALLLACAEQVRDSHSIVHFLTGVAPGIWTGRIYVRLQQQHNASQTAIRRTSLQLERHRQGAGRCIIHMQAERFA